MSLVTGLTIATVIIFISVKSIISFRPTNVIDNSLELNILVNAYACANSTTERYETALKISSALQSEIEKGNSINLSEIKKYFGKPDSVDLDGFVIRYDISVDNKYSEIAFYSGDFMQSVRRISVSLPID